jgi:class 3 adenylate cyclase
VQNYPNEPLAPPSLPTFPAFTPLTKALAEELGPKRGAEEVLRHINPVYEALITELHRYRGAVIGFAGDSITCWFDENIPEADLTGFDKPVRSAGRALACALAMQAAMQAFATVRNGRRNPHEYCRQNRLSRWFRPAALSWATRPFSALTPWSGATLDQVAAVERSHGERGNCRQRRSWSQIMGATAVAIAAWREDEETGDRFAVITGLSQPVAPHPWPELAADALPTETVRSWLLPPVYERLQGSGGFLAELRPAVALFLKFGGLDYDGDAEVGGKLNAYVQWVQSVLARYEGYLIQLTIGDKGSYLYAAFGAPLAHDDDAPRAVAAALDLQTPPAALNFIQRTQMGLSQGRMWSGACGATARRTYGVMGAETNMAARLMSRATPGQILVSQRLAGAVGVNYYLNYLGLVPIKGQPEPMAISEVLGRQTTLPSRPSNLYAAPLVDRESVLAEMNETRQLAAAGQGQIARVEGSTGVGKSHLLAVFSEQAVNQGWRAAVGHCLSINQSIAYMPWRQIFYNLFDMTQEVAANPPPEQLAARVEAIIRAANPDWLVRLPLLGDLLGLPIADNPTTAAFDASLRQKSLFALAVAILQSWTRRQPLLLLLEDIHWMDDASLALTTAVGRASAQEPLLLTLAQRPIATIWSAAAAGVERPAQPSSLQPARTVALRRGGHDRQPAAWRGLPHRSIAGRRPHRGQPVLCGGVGGQPARIGGAAAGTGGIRPLVACG